MQFVDYYDTLGVAADADVAAIKNAYRKLARKYHPDVSQEPDAEARFKTIGEAWNVLKDEERRAEYDTLRQRVASGEHEARPGAQQRGWRADEGYGPDPFSGGFADTDASDFFRDWFGARAAAGGAGGGPRAAGAGAARRGEDAHVQLSIDLPTAFAGARLPLTLRVPAYTAAGAVRLDEKTLRVTIPSGTLHGRKLRLTGQGGPGLGDAPAGDLYIEIAIEPHDRFTLNGRDIESVVDIAPWDAALGASLDVQTLGGSVQMQVPAGSSGGRRLRLKGRGMPARSPGGVGDAAAGDHYVTLRVKLSKPSTERERQAWKALQEACSSSGNTSGSVT